ncbi:coiled-coil domain-containing protein [Paraliomyxa miuraensis]|uniref:hypothetical protein n=1 Tax=Paraliomyxa miuraensis TaxID=376150 RepID=UPI0022569A13|nr:hypothetical protein [Paraliomyxa miuraensis]MCX4246780.1 hypothetical protein [Paraliomyxa miuraensis]
MGLFGRKNEEPAPKPELASKPEPVMSPEPAPQPKIQVAAPAPAPVRAPAPPPSPEFGIQKAMELMRKLPADNTPLVVQVVRATLESTNVDVTSIISDAKDKRRRIEARIENLRHEIVEFEEEISARRQEISALEADEAETKNVQERLEMAMGSEDDPFKAS